MNDTHDKTCGASKDSQTFEWYFPHWTNDISNSIYLCKLTSPQ